MSQDGQAREARFTRLYEDEGKIARETLYYTRANVPFQP
jgi:hypothetical protein